ncbi:MAG: class I SAM-dependent methyltransferase [Mesorhizobium sp.]|uniref:class I SAM-dependent methyltransferase n=1 Tax=Mesorhizobium sp. TaxID=1871066 RepID=UPI00120FB22A|nr:class I SAM-dependent methyltransferase [Mesorhizobium sp.]TIW11282.1 MAG: class I SAM-dependent methyltransferase [Mesorhizobium sp.]
MTMLQVEAEIDALADLFATEGVRSFLEIGSKFGGSLSRIAARLPAGSRIVSVDMPAGTVAWPQSEAELKAVIARLQLQGFDAHVIWGDSTAATVIDKVRAFGTFDAVFIDANHTLPFVEKDFANYGEMARLVAFHDIAWHRAPEWKEGKRIDVPVFWERVKGAHRHREFKFCPTGKNNGIGVLWRT